MLLKSSRNSGLSRCRETSEPDGSTLLLAKFAALLAAKALVPCDVAGGVSEGDLKSIDVVRNLYSTYVAIVICCEILLKCVCGGYYSDLRFPLRDASTQKC